MTREDIVRDILLAGPNVMTLAINGTDGRVKQSLELFGLECHDGWLPLIHEAIKEIESIVTGNAGDLANNYVVQIKSKLGGLRIYMALHDIRVNAVIKKAEQRALETCERCGEPGEQMVAAHWIHTTCQNCWENKNGSM
jgi:hypothetical protein